VILTSLLIVALVFIIRVLTAIRGPFAYFFEFLTCLMSVVYGLTFFSGDFRLLLVFFNISFFLL